MKASTNTFHQTVWSFLGYLYLKFRFVAIALFILAIAKGISSVLNIYALTNLIGVVEQTEPSSLFENIRPALIFFLVMGVINTTFTRVIEWVRRVMYGSRIEYTAPFETYRYILKHSYTFFTNTFAGTIGNKISDLRRGAFDITWIFVEGLMQITLLFLMIGFFFKVDLVISVLSFSWMFFHLLYCFFRFKKWNALSFEVGDQRSKNMGKMIDTITNFVNVKLFARRSYENTRAKQFLSDATRKRDRYVRMMQIDYTILNFAMLITLYTIVFVLLHRYQSGAITIGGFTFVLFGFLRITDAVYTLGHSISEFSESYGTTRQALDAISKPIEMIDTKNAKLLTVKKGMIDFRHVSFAYPKGKKVLNDLNLHIKHGEKVGIVGHSGAGKSTLIHLLLRYFDIQQGQILIDGQSISQVTQDSLHEAISMIPQDTGLFHRSIMDNIRYGRLDATDKEVIEAAKKAHAHEFILNLPQKYDSLVGERGVKLSVGQRQRIAIARAILKDAPILILDEATSALDSETERLIQDSFSKLMKGGRTSLVVAHRLSTLREMDRIIVFDKGKVVEEGSHNQLIRKKNGLYAKLWSMQSDGFLPTALDNVNKPESDF